MIEILFSEGAAGSMMLSKSLKNISGTSTTVILRKEDGSYPSPEELAREQARVEEEWRIKIEQAVLVEGDIQDIVCIPLNLSIGDISAPFSDERAEYLQSLMMIGGEEFSLVGHELMATARKALEKLRALREPVRIWTNQHPNELCGLYHVLTLLPQDADIRVVELPVYEVMEGEIRTHTAWADVDPMDLGRYLILERSLSITERRYFAGLWRELQAENGPLRAVINGKLCTVPLDFYDFIILRELSKQPEEFHEARLIGEILGKYPLGLSDALVAMRIEEFISRGMLVPVSEPEPDHPIYHRFLRKEPGYEAFS